MANTDGAEDGEAVDGENCEVAVLISPFWSNICGRDSSATFRWARNHVVRYIVMDIILSILTCQYQVVSDSRLVSSSVKVHNQHT